MNRNILLPRRSNRIGIVELIRLDWQSTRRHWKYVGGRIAEHFRRRSNYRYYRSRGLDHAAATYLAENTI